MEVDLTKQSPAQILASLPERQRMKELAKLTPEVRARLKWHWPFWARPNQLAPLGEWQTWLVLAGRGFGKTEAGAQWVRDRVKNGARHVALIAETQKDLEEVMVARLLAITPPDERPSVRYKPVRLVWPNGATGTGYSGTEPDQLRGPEFDTAWCFIAGTMVQTDAGLLPIERVTSSHRVLTRTGYQRVRANGARVAQTGTVSFSNGQKLIGTADHPIYTAHGWTKLSYLRNGDEVCAINVSSGVATDGTATATAITKDQKSLTGGKSLLRYIARFTRRITEACQKATTSTTRTKTKPTTLRQTSKRSPAPSTENCTLSAGPNSPHGTETFAASVASTWQPLGEQEVFCLSVEQSREYFANGILVHNCDELAKYPYARDLWDMLQFTMRKPDPRVLVTTTPRPIPVIKEILADPTTKVTRGSTLDNKDNLPASFLRAVVSKYAGTRLGRQELEAEILDDVAGALWTRAMLDETRVKEPPELQRIVVAVDPSGTKGAAAGSKKSAAAGSKKSASDEVGIVIAGLGMDGRGYVLADWTCNLGPAGWGRRAVEAYSTFGADRIIAESNFGGAMVESTIRATDQNVPVTLVNASRGKVARAEPVAALFEQGRVSMVGGMAALEDQLCAFTPSGYIGEKSPDRGDAMVWALTELMLDEVKSAGFLALIRKQNAERAAAAAATEAAKAEPEQPAAQAAATPAPPAAPQPQSGECPYAKGSVEYERWHGRA